MKNNKIIVTLKQFKIINQIYKYNHKNMQRKKNINFEKWIKIIKKINKINFK